MNTDQNFLVASHRVRSEASTGRQLAALQRVALALPVFSVAKDFRPVLKSMSLEPPSCDEPLNGLGDAAPEVFRALNL